MIFNCFPNLGDVNKFKRANALSSSTTKTFSAVMAFVVGSRFIIIYESLKIANLQVVQSYTCDIHTRFDLKKRWR